MDAELPDRSIKKLRVDTRVLSDVIGMMSRDGRRVIVKIDDAKVDDPATITAADLSGATEVDVSSFWVNPDRPTFGRRHFVYFLAGPSGAKYFGDSVSPEVVSVCADLDRYFNQQMAPAAATTPLSGAGGLPAWWPRGWLFEGPERFLSALALLGLFIAVLAFMVGRWSAGQEMAATLATPVRVEPQPGTPTTNAADLEAEQRLQQ